jgi:iron complex transport system substrate-binding protein
VTRIDAHNAGALSLAIAASLLGAGSVQRGVEVRVEQIAPRSMQLQEISLPNGEHGVRDASGVVAPLRPYRRIASASLVSDSVLWELCEPERLVAVTRKTKESTHFGYRHRQRAGIASAQDLEAILALHPDLLFTNRFGDPRYAAELRARGVVVFDLGEMLGLESLLPDITIIGRLVGADERAARLRTELLERLQAVAADIPRGARPRGLYLSAYGKQLFGGAAATSYHDVLEYGGVDDVAAPRYRGWPALDAERVLSLDPEVLVTKRGMAKEVCRAPGLGLLRPCRGQGRIAELDNDLVDDPSLPILELAESLRTQIHGPRKAH